MAASTANQFGAKVATRAASTIPVPVAATTEIFKNVYVCFDGNGNVVPAADTSGLVFAGQSAQYVNNTSTAGAVSIDIVPLANLRLIQIGATSPARATWVGRLVYFTGDTTAALAATTTNDVVVGMCVDIVQTGTSGVILVDTSIRA